MRHLHTCTDLHQCSQTDFSNVIYVQAHKRMYVSHYDLQR